MLCRLGSANRIWDMLVIGGGATGLGIAWNASACGYSVALLEAADFAQATSSRSTKLIHGGVRYLRQGQIGMVRSSLREREFLLRAATPLVWPLRMVIPSYRLGSRWYYLAGLKAYDWLAGKLNMQPASLVSATQVHQLLPTVKTQGLRGGVAFCDGQFDDARLSIAVAQQVAGSPNAALLNHAPVMALDTETSTGLRVVEARDETTGQTLQCRARVVINATGVFADRVGGLERDYSATNDIRIAPSRGTHIVLPGRFLDSDHALMIPQTDDGRVLFAIPWLGHTLLGTTDVPTQSVDYEPQATGAEIDYMLDHAARYLQLAPQRSDVLSVFSGLRPLISPASGGVTSKLSREHQIVVSKQGLISIIGGKWTTFRKMGRDVVELATQVGGLSKRVYQAPTLSIESTACSDEPLLDPELPIRSSDISRAVNLEMAVKLQDVLSRRTRCLLLNAAASQRVAPLVAELMRQSIGQSQTWVTAQLEEFSRLAQRYQSPPSS